MKNLREIRESSPYTPQYKTLTGAAHTRPTQEIGAPTLIWHLAVWPRSGEDPENVRFESGGDNNFKLDEDDDRLEKIKKDKLLEFDLAISEQNRRRRVIIGLSGGSKPEQNSTIGALNLFLHDLQKKGRYGSDKKGIFGLKSALDIDHIKTEEVVKFKFAYPESLEFTLWWKYDPLVRRNALSVRDSLPGFDALRIRVQVEAQPDYFAITFLADIGKCWHSGSVYSADEVPGAGRKHVFEAVERIKAACEARLQNGEIERPLLPLEQTQPKQGVSPSHLQQILENDYAAAQSDPKRTADASAILRDTELLYSQFWVHFCQDFGFSVRDIVGKQGRVFANFRGVVLSTKGLASGPASPRTVDSPGSNHFPRFGDDLPGAQGGSTEERASSEANAVVKAFWPMVRRMKPYADSQQYIACGVLNWRALYITALGSGREYHEGDESLARKYEDPCGSLPELSERAAPDAIRYVDDPQIGPEGEEPVRYLILTKHDPHRWQLGRIVDRINATGTTRLFALRNLSLIRAASHHIRLRGQQLDEIQQQWINRRRELRNKHKDDDNSDALNKALATLNADVEDKLLEAGSALNSIGKKAVGGLLYRISRSKLYAQRFDDLRRDLLVGNIESWTSYNQFALRNMQPLFNYIEQTGDRLARLRKRLATVMENIQTAAIVSQTEETRKNTRELEKLQSSATNLGLLGAFGLLIASVQPLESLVSKWHDKCIKPGVISGQIVCQSYNEIFGAGEDGKVEAFWNLFVITAIVLGTIALFLNVRHVGWRRTFKGCTLISFIALLASKAVLTFDLAGGSISEASRLIYEWGRYPLFAFAALWVFSMLLKRIGRKLRRLRQKRPVLWGFRVS